MSAGEILARFAAVDGFCIRGITKSDQIRELISGRPSPKNTNRYHESYQ